MGKEEWRRNSVTDADFQWLTKNLASSIFFTQEDLVKIMAPKFESYSVPKGTVIVQEGGSGNDVFLIQGGTVSVTKAGAEVSQLGPGCYFGEMAVLVNREIRVATIKALEPCRFFILSGSQFRSLLRENPHLKLFLQKVAKARGEGFKNS